MTFTEFTYSCADTMLSEHRYSTAHLYRNAHRAFSHYLGGCDVEFTDFTRPALRPEPAVTLKTGERRLFPFMFHRNCLTESILW